MSPETTQTTQTTTDAPTTSTHVEAAKALIDQIHAMQQQIPTFSFPAERNSTQKLVSAASVPHEVIDKVTALVQTKPLLTGNDLGPNELRDLVSFASSYGPVPDELEAFAQGLRHSVMTALNKAGSAALTVYEVAKRQSRRPESADLRPHVADLKRLLGTRFKGGKKAPRTTPTPAPQPSPQTSTSSQSKVQPQASASGSTDPVVTAPASSLTAKS
jgi:hypothetical protein